MSRLRDYMPIASTFFDCLSRMDTKNFYAGSRVKIHMWKFKPETVEKNLSTIDPSAEIEFMPLRC